MGALSSIRKRGDDYFTKSSASPPIDYQRFGHVSKKPRFAVSTISSSSSNYKPQYSGSSAVSRISLYPDTKSRFRREVHAPVRNSRFGFLSAFRKSESSGGDCKEEGLGDKMGNILGNCLGVQYEKTKRSAFKTFRFYGVEEEDLIGKEKEEEKEVIEIDDDEDVVVRCDSRDGENVEEAGFVEGKDGYGLVQTPRGVKAEMAEEKGLPSFGSSARSDVSNVNGGIEGKVGSMVLGQERNDSGVPHYRRLLEDSRKRDGKLNNLKFDIELNEKRSQGYYFLRSHKKPERVKDWAEECFKSLTKDEEAEVARAFHGSNRRKIVVSHENSNIDINGEKIQCLKPGAWLNDEVINVYLELLKEREKREPEKFLKCHFFNTFFYKKLIGGKDGYNFQSVRRWTTQRKLGYSLLECDKIFVPIHQQIHWCLAVINNKEQKFQYLDSLKGADSRVLNVLARYYVDEVKDKCGKDIDVSSWKLEFVSDLPEQKNGFDCGVFMIKYADFYSRDVGLCFTQENMPYFRKRTAKELLKLRAE